MLLLRMQAVVSLTPVHMRALCLFAFPGLQKSGGISMVPVQDEESTRLLQDSKMGGTSSSTALAGSGGTPLSSRG